MLDAPKVKVAGIHLAGPNSNKTTLVIMTGRLGEGNLKISSVHDRMGALHKLFSDDRLFDILRNQRPDSIMIDSPLTVPPCVACTRVSCPGVNACEDISVAYMQMLLESQTGKRRKRPLNPQTQRIWDVKEWFKWQPSLQEPTYSANKAPLVVRAMTLQKRLNSLAEAPVMRETSIPHAMSVLVDQLDLEAELAYEYRAFEVGRKRRLKLLQALSERAFIAGPIDDAIVASVEGFSAYMAALVAALELEGLCTKPQSDFFLQQGWVYLPELLCEYPRTRSVL